MKPPLFLGIEIGGTKLQLGVGNGRGEIFAFERRAIVADAGASGIRDAILATLPILTQRLGIERCALAAVGIGFGGPVDVQQGITTTSHQIAGWDGYPLADWIRQNAGIERVAICNDADTAGVAEARFGAGIGVSPVLYVTIGSGIGGGLIVDGKIYRGAGQGAVEIGHLWINDPADPATPADLLEHVASGWGIGRYARQLVQQAMLSQEDAGQMLVCCNGKIDSIDAQTVAQASLAGDLRAQMVLDRAVGAMAQALGHAVTLLAPARIILGGGVSLMDESLWLDAIGYKLGCQVFPAFRQSFQIVPAALGEKVVVHGALALARDSQNDDV